MSEAPEPPIEPIAPPTEASAAPLLAPGKGSPLVPGQPASVTSPLPARRVNFVFGASGVIVILAVLAIVIIAGALILGALGHKPG